MSIFPFNVAMMEAVEQGLHPITQAWLDQIGTNGDTEPTNTDDIDTMIRSLVDEGVLHETPSSGLADIFYIFSNDGDAGASEVNVVDPTSFQITQVNSPGWTAADGFESNGSNSYLNTTFNMNTNKINMTTTSFGAITKLLLVDATELSTVFGADDNAGGSREAIRMIYRSGISAYRNFFGPISSRDYSVTPANDDTYLFNLVGTQPNIYKNGTLATSFSTISTPGAMPDARIFIGALDFGGSATAFANHKYPFFLAGADLSGVQGAIDTIFDTYMATR